MARFYVGPNGEGRRADLNNDGIIDSADLDKLKVCYLKNTDEYPQCEIADVNGDGFVNSLDFSMLAQIFGGYDPVSKTALQPVPDRPKRSLLLPMVIGGAVVGGLLLAGRKK